MVDQSRERAALLDALEQTRDALDEDDKGKSDEELRENYRTISQRRVRLGLLLAEVGRANELTVTQDDLNRAIA